MEGEAHSKRMQELEAKRKKVEELRRKRAQDVNSMSLAHSSAADRTEIGCQTEMSTPPPPEPSSPSPGNGSPLRRRAHSRIIHGYTQQQQPLTAEVQESIYERNDFREFLDRSSKMVEIALNNQTSAGVFQNLDSDNDGNCALNDSEGISLSLSGARVHDSCKGRPVTSIKWNPHRPEQLVSAYGEKNTRVSPSDFNDEPLGLVCVWSELLPMRPEYTFHSSSPVLCVDFHTLNPHLLVGTCYSGPLLIWDMRVRGKGAVKRSNPSAEGVHTHPVYSMCTIGNTESSHALLSGDLEGNLCCWRNSQDRISSPTASWALHLENIPINGELSGECGPAYPPTSVSATRGNGYFHSRITVPSPLQRDETPISSDYLQSSFNRGSTVASAPLSLTCMGLGNPGHSSVTRSIFFGTTQGQLCRANWPVKDNDTFEWISAHDAFISALHCNPHPQRSFRDLIITASFDWKVKLWAPSVYPGSTTSKQSSFNRSTSTNNDDNDQIMPILPLMEFRGQEYEYVSDVLWSPSNPCVFAAASSGGQVSLWDISHSIVEPWGTCNVVSEALLMDDSSLSFPSRTQGGSTSTNTAPKKLPISKLGWSPDGTRIVCGDSQGTLYLVNISKEFTSCSPEAAAKVEDMIISRRSQLANEATSNALIEHEDTLALGASLDHHDL